MNNNHTKRKQTKVYQLRNLDQQVQNQFKFVVEKLKVGRWDTKIYSNIGKHRIQGFIRNEQTQAELPITLNIDQNHFLGDYSASRNLEISSSDGNRFWLSDDDKLGAIIHQQRMYASYDPLTEITRIHEEGRLLALFQPGPSKKSEDMHKIYFQKNLAPRKLNALIKVFIIYKKASYMRRNSEELLKQHEADKERFDYDG